MSPAMNPAVNCTMKPNVNRHVNRPLIRPANRAANPATSHQMNRPKTPIATLRSARNIGRAPIRSDRGDVPGWVLISLMTAGLVVLIWALAGPALSNVFNEAINRVLNF